MRIQDSLSGFFPNLHCYLGGHINSINLFQEKKLKHYDFRPDNLNKKVRTLSLILF
jgi:hypothetical protein